MTAKVRQVDLPPSARELSTLPRIDYSDAFLFDAGSTRDVSAEDLMRGSPGRRSGGRPSPASVRMVGHRAEGAHRVGTIGARLGDPQGSARSCASRCRLAHRNARRVASQEGGRRTAFRDIRGAAESARPGSMDRHRTRACSGRARTCWARRVGGSAPESGRRARAPAAAQARAPRAARRRQVLAPSGSPTSPAVAPRSRSWAAV